MVHLLIPDLNSIRKNKFTYFTHIQIYSYILCQSIFSSSFSICSMLLLVGWCLFDDISPSITVLRKYFFQVQSLQIILKNLVPNVAWSSSPCSTNPETSTSANPVLSFHPFYVAKPRKLHLSHDHRNILYS